MGKFRQALEEREVLILDGGLGTELEFQGYDVSGQLWSAKYLLDNPAVLQGIHELYVRAGSDIITTASYQATLEGLKAYGLPEKQALSLLRLTVELVQKAIAQVWQDLSEDERQKRPYPLVAGSVGPYAAYLADGSEYTGAYQLTKEEYQDFHRPRIAALLEAGADLLAIETIPNAAEAAALVDLLAKEFPTTEAYFSFTAKNGQQLVDGTDIADLGALCQASPQVLALGINCTPPAFLSSLLERLKTTSAKPLLTYPNSGEIYDGNKKTWHKDKEESQTLLSYSKLWQEKGVRLVGGCCRTRPADIAELASYFKG
ncbi:homocysteine S-methyltransferase [Streptococcus oricebi]|uniref:Homocysteine S-methyltransferase n=1 Tax=Streptococcus oricebi TaxID=1547447 RepID=A0ABS5B2Y3_9STRE|nr:homocysteine S-methyltransferase [Streptococcus oricebi]MBP2623184.1 homocysteine S-methyltransferase [Streptococcus oricebi]